MPVLRSQRSKPSTKKAEDDMPPPSSTRSTRTRSKKASKQEEELVSDEPESPAPAPSSTRSTRTRTRSKAVPVEEVEIASPPSARSTRSTRSKTAVSKIISGSTTKGQQKNTRSVASSVNPVVQLSPLVLESKEKKPIRTVAKKKQQAVKRKGKDPVESTSDTLSEDGSEVEDEKPLTLEQLHNQYAAPLKTALGMAVCEVYPKCMAKLMDKSTSEKQEREFQRLMSIPCEMPPPLAPAPKVKAKAKKGRPKRARSPETPSLKHTEVPTSFNFADNNLEHIPAKKKMIIDPPTPEREDVPEMSNKEEDNSKPVPFPCSSDEGKKKVKKESANPESTVKNNFAENNLEMHIPVKKKMIVNPPTTAREDVPEVSNKEEDSSKPFPFPCSDDEGKKKVTKGPANPEGKVKNKKLASSKTDKKTKKEKKVKGDSQSDNSTPTPTPTSKDTKEPEPTPTSKDTKEPEPNPANPPKVKNVPVTTKEMQVNVIAPPPAPKPNQEKDEVKKSDLADIFEQSTVDMADDSVMIIDEIDKVQTETITTKKQDDERKTEPVERKSPIVTENANAALNATYVAETPTESELKQNANATFTPELFPDTPKSRIADQTMVITKHTEAASKVLAPSSPELDSEGKTATVSSASGKVLNLVNFFDKNKKEVDAKKGTVVNSSSSSSKTDNKVELDKTRTVSPHLSDSVDDKPSAINNDLNSTYVLPTVSKTKTASASVMNVTMCVKKVPVLETDDVPKPDGFKPIVPPSSAFIPPTNSSHFMHDSPASRTFCKEPLSLATLVEEDDAKDTVTSEPKSDKAITIVPIIKPVSKEKTKDKTASSSSSTSSSSSMKSASSQPCLVTKKLPTNALKNAPIYGSSGKLNDANKAKQDAEKRRNELLKQKIESSKKKNAEWSKKTEKNKLEEEKRIKEIKEKQKGVQPLMASMPSSSSIMKKPQATLFGKPTFDGPAAVLGKPKYNFGPAKMPATTTLLPPLSKNPFHKPVAPLPPPPLDPEMDDSFKSACNSFLDQTGETHLSSYDITVYEDLDEDLKHRENKTVPHWASNKDALNTALYSMVLLPEYESKFHGGFPKPDKSYKLFPNRMGHH